MKTIAFLNIKGGVGKTTSATTIAHILATKHKKKVLLVDLDAQANSTAMFNKEEGEGFFDDDDFKPLPYSIGNLLVDKEIDTHTCIQHTEYERLDVIESDLQLTEIEERLKADVTTPQQFRLKKHLDRLEKEYDYCILDCSPSVGIVNINGLAAADEVYIPCRADRYSVNGVAMAKGLIDTISEYNCKLKIGGIFFVQWKEKENVSYVSYEKMKMKYPEYLLPIKIHNTTLVAQSSVEKIPLAEWDSGKGKSKATINYLRLAEYIDSAGRKEYLKQLEDELQGEK